MLPLPLPLLLLFSSFPSSSPPPPSSFSPSFSSSSFPYSYSPSSSSPPLSSSTSSSYGSSVRFLTMAFFFLHSPLCLAAARQFFVLGNLVPSPHTASFHLFLGFLAVLLPPRYFFQYYFWDSVAGRPSCTPSLL